MAGQILTLLGDGQPRSTEELATRLGIPSVALTPALAGLVSQAQIQRAGTRTVASPSGGRCRVSLWRLPNQH